MNLTPPSSPPRAARAWSSPLGSKQPPPIHDTTNAVGKRILFHHGHEHTTKKTAPLGGALEELYPLTTQTPRPWILTELLENLEFAFKRHPEQIDELRACVRRTLLNYFTIEDRMAELGMLLFYLDRDSAIPDSYSLVQHRAAQMEKEIENYLQAHAIAGNAELPSGKTHYILRAFVHMILTSKQVYNLGGLYTIQHLLCRAYSISKYLEPEHRQHILAVTHQLLSSTAFISVFRKEAKVHKDLEHMIRLDLKLKHEDQILSVHILYACLMALYTDIRQTASSNCYAIAALIYASENHTYKTLTLLLDHIAKGHYQFNTDTRITLAPLIKKRLAAGHQSIGTIQLQQMTTLACIEHIFETLALRPTSQSVTSPEPIRASLSSLLEQQNASHHLIYAEELFSTYTQNTLVHLLLKVLEFVNDNDTWPNRAPPTQLYSDFKHEFLRGCKEALLAGCKHMTIAQDLIDSILDRIGKALWFEYDPLPNVTVEGSNISAGILSVKQYRGDADTLADLLKNCLRLYYLSGDAYTPIFTLSALQKAVVEQIESACRAHNPPVRLPLQRQLILGAQSKDFKEFIAIHAASQIQANIGEEEYLDADDLQSTDLLLFAQVGGWEEKVLQTVYGIDLVPLHVEGQTPTKFLQQLSSVLLELKEEPLFKHIPKIVVVTEGASVGHAWTLTPSCWKLLLENQKRFSSFLQTTILKPAQEFLDRPAPLQNVRAMMGLAIPDFEQRKGLEKTLKKPTITYRMLRDTLLSASTPDTAQSIVELIEEKFWDIQLNPDSLEQILLKLGIHSNLEIRRDILSNISSFPAPPYQVARQLRNSLIAHKQQVKDPYELEILLCQTFGLPPPVAMGDLNWSASSGEAPYHIHLMAQFSWTKGEIWYFVRRNTSQVMETNESYRTFKILLPPTIKSTI